MKLIGICLCLVFLSGCATSMNEIISSKELGTRKTYSVSSDQAWKISKTVLRWGMAEVIGSCGDVDELVELFIGS
ncbi:MAG: hypothetical protein AB1805_05455 [Nitrospirota bacterium]